MYISLTSSTIVKSTTEIILFVIESIQRQGWLDLAESMYKIISTNSIIITWPDFMGGQNINRFDTKMVSFGNQTIHMDPSSKRFIIFRNETWILNKFIKYTALQLDFEASYF